MSPKHVTKNGVVLVHDCRVIISPVAVRRCHHRSPVAGTVPVSRAVTDSTWVLKILSTLLREIMEEASRSRIVDAIRDGKFQTKNRLGSSLRTYLCSPASINIFALIDGGHDYAWGQKRRLPHQRGLEGQELETAMVYSWTKLSFILQIARTCRTSAQADLDSFLDLSDFDRCLLLFVQ